MTVLHEVLKHLQACAGARDFASQYDNLRDAWFACPNLEWKEWFASSLPDFNYTEYTDNRARLFQSGFDATTERSLNHALIDTYFVRIEEAFFDYHQNQVVDGPGDGDYVIDYRNGVYEHPSNFLLHASSREEAEQFIIRRANEEQFFPNVFSLSDHGNWIKLQFNYA